MIFVSEETIDLYIERFQYEEEYTKELESLRNENEILLQFIDTSRIELLTDEEGSLLEFMAVVMYHACKDKIGKAPSITGNVLEEMEEKNWEIWNEHIKSSIKAVFDVFFIDYPQEDLLAFVEDSLQQDEDWPVSTAGIELITVIAKSIIDTLDSLN